MKTISKHDQTEPQRVLEHISVAGPEGEIRYLRFVTRDESNRSGSSFGAGLVANTGTSQRASLSLA